MPFLAFDPLTVRMREVIGNESLSRSKGSSFEGPEQGWWQQVTLIFKHAKE